MILCCSVNFFWQLSRGPSVCLNSSVTEVAAHSAECNTKLFCAYSSFLNLPSCSVVPVQFCSPIKPCSNVPPRKTLHSFQTIFCKMQWQVNPALFMATSVDRNLSFSWLEVPYKHAYFEYGVALESHLPSLQRVTKLHQVIQTVYKGGKKRYFWLTRGAFK